MPIAITSPSWLMAWATALNVLPHTYRPAFGHAFDPAIRVLGQTAWRGANG